MSEEDIKEEEASTILDSKETGDKEIFREIVRGNDLIFQLWKQADRLADGSSIIRILMMIIIFLLVVIVLLLSFA